MLVFNYGKAGIEAYYLVEEYEAVVYRIRELRKTIVQAAHTVLCG